VNFFPLKDRPPILAPRACDRSTFTQIAFTFIILLSTCRADSLAETCRARVQSMLPRFLAVAGPFDDDLLSSSLKKCGDMAAPNVHSAEGKEEPADRDCAGNRLGIGRVSAFNRPRVAQKASFG
jgi:hypothetical protein